MKRLIVCFRLRGAAARVAGGTSLATVVDELVGAARRLGGRIVAWNVAMFIFDFVPTAVDAAIELAADSTAGEDGAATFSVGIAEGDLHVSVDAGEGVALSLGLGLVRAAGLARIARPGEVLVDPLLDSVASGELLTRGARLGTHGRQRLRGLVLDLQSPWRSGVAVSPSRLSVPKRVGPTLAGVEVEPGTLGLLEAGRGLGGTRFLADFAAAHAPALRVTPDPMGEPLGALRTAFVRSGLMRGQVDVEPAAQASLEALLGGEGLELEASSALVASWLDASAERYVLIDDARDVDADTLECLAAACTTFDLKLIARVPGRGLLPSPLRSLERGATVKLSMLSPEGAADLAVAYTGGELEDGAMARIARLGGDTPLGIAEALRAALESGDLAWDDDGVAPRSRHASQGDTRGPEHWMFRRLRYIDSNARTLLDALAVLGGEAELSELREFLRRIDAEVDTAAAREALVEGCWIEETAGQLLTLASATLHDLVERVMAPERNAAWHRHVAELFAECHRPLAMGAAVLHALQSGDVELARRFAHRVSASARAAGLTASAEAFESFAIHAEVGQLQERGLTGGRSLGDLFEPATVRRASIPSEPASQPAQVLTALGGDAEADLTRQVMVALREGNFDRVEQLTSRLRGDHSQEQLADRLDALAAVARGAHGEALRLLWQSKERSRELSPVERCRASLALGLGLAAAGRSSDALLEALDGLARAREAEDERGERACARLVAQLTSAAGRPDLAAAWESLAAG